MTEFKYTKFKDPKDLPDYVKNDILTDLFTSIRSRFIAYVEDGDTDICWASLAAAALPKSYVVEERLPKKGETYWFDGDWMVAHQDHHDVPRLVRVAE